MAKVNNATLKIAIDTVKDSSDVNIYNIPRTDLKDLNNQLNEVKRYVEGKTKPPRDVLIIVSVRS